MEQEDNPSLENTQSTPEDQAPVQPAAPEFTESAQPKTKKWLIVGLVAFAAALLTTVGFLIYQNLQLKKQPSQPTPASQTAPTPATTSPTTQPDETAGWETYVIDERVSFEYPPTWAVLTVSPEEYRFENGGMFVTNCTLFLQNKEEKSTVIAMDMKLMAEESAGGTYCWSGGGSNGETYTRKIETLSLQPEIEVIKWKEADNNQVPPPSWQGIYFQAYYNLAKGPTVSLVFKEDRDPTAETVFDQILSTFKFTD